MKILIAYDGSDRSVEVLEDLPKDLPKAGLPREAEVIVVTVSRVRLPDPPPAGGEMTHAVYGSRRVKAALVKSYENALRVKGEAHTIALQGADRVRQIFPFWKVSAEALSGDPAGELLGRAGDWGANLIVVGSRGRSLFGRLVGGSVPRKVAIAARCSVRVVRSPGGTGDYRPAILVGADGSQGSRAAVAAVARRVWPLGTRVRLVTCVKPFGQYGPSPDGQVAASVAVLQDAAQILRDAGVIAESAVLKGEPAGVLAREAKKWDASCVFVGSGDKRGFESYMLGSVSAALVKNAPCTIEVVRGRG